MPTSGITISLLVVRIQPVKLSFIDDPSVRASLKTVPIHLRDFFFHPRKQCFLLLSLDQHTIGGDTSLPAIGVFSPDDPPCRHSNRCTTSRSEERRVGKEWRWRRTRRTYNT